MSLINMALMIIQLVIINETVKIMDEPPEHLDYHSKYVQISSGLLFALVAFNIQRIRFWQYLYISDDQMYQKWIIIIN